MTDKELIKQEIERLIDIEEETSHLDKVSFNSGRWKALTQVKVFIDSIPEESGCEVNFTTKNEDFESEWKRYINSKGGGAVTINVKDIARHFAEWQKQKDLEDSLKSDLTMPNKFYEKGKADAMNEMKESLQTEYEKGRFDMREEMKEHINNIISCLEEYLQPGFPIFKAGISKEITWLNSLINKND